MELSTLAETYGGFALWANTTETRWESPAFPGIFRQIRLDAWVAPPLPPFGLKGVQRQAGLLADRSKEGILRPSQYDSWD